MAAYGVPQDLDGVLPWEWARERLDGSRCYWIATASAAGRPHLTPVWGVWLEDPDAVWFSCASTALKTRDLTANSAVTVATDDARAFVSLNGTAVRLDGDSDLARGVEAYWRKYGAEMEMDVGAIADFVRANAVFSVTPARAVAIIETPEDFGPRATRWRW